ncbi:Gfo/Idh/MocA family oxidoreductase [candidate division WOR-3 bacterium]|nr:Gfo/Idh/MocA family oxidoreductase [candidate division WOR-3 bacterium]
MKTALIGFGYWGPNLARNAVSLSGVDLKYICDKDEKRLFEASSKYTGAKTVEDANIIFKDCDVKSVIIATGVSTHYPLVKKALKSGKDVFVEKPMTSSYKEAKELVALAKEKSKILMVGHTFLYSPPVLKIKEILDSGELGEIYFITSQRVNLGKHQKDTSVIWDLAPHDLSIFSFWLGTKPVVLGSFGNSYIIKGVPDVAFIHLRYPEEICVNLELGWLAPSKLRHTAIVGSKKMLVYNDLDYEEKVKIFDLGVDYKDPETYGEYQLSYRTGDIHSPYIQSKEPLFLEMKDFFDSINERRQPISSCEFALDIVRICEDAENILNKKNNRG